MINIGNHKLFHQSESTISGYKPLEYYGLIGNTETCALIGADGAIDWLCLPHMESGSVFAALLDKDKGGHFTIQPKLKFKSYQKYVEGTNILQTFFSCSSGEAVITDFMPPFKKRTVWHKSHLLFRNIKCTRGFVDFEVVFDPRFNYARAKSDLQQTERGVVANYEDERLYLDGYFPLQIKGRQARGEFTVSNKNDSWVVLQYNSHANFQPKDCQKEYEETFRFWKKWVHDCDRAKCVFKGPWHDLVVRSGLVLKLLTHGETGSIAAAATTSLPETIGGARNWDYRFNWIRDSVFAAQALYNLGHYREAKELFNWYKKIYKGVSISDIKILHGMHGEQEVPEVKLRHLAGYRNSKPVRIGNAAIDQFQLDIYGELLNVAYETSRYGESISQNDWRLLKRVVDHVCRVWQQPDAGIWEARTKPRHYVFSKVMCWVAIDRGIKIAEKKGFKAPFERWSETREEIKKTVLQKGFNKNLNSFVQSFNSKALDATSLLIPILGFLPFDDYRIKGTINATLKRLTKDGQVYRYLNDDGLSGHEGTFTLCTFWLVDALALSGRVKEAEKIFLNIIKNVNRLGLLAEEYDVAKKEQLGNFPQAFSHIGMINSALYIGLAKGQQARGPQPLGLLTSKILEKFKNQLKRGAAILPKIKLS